MKVIKEMADIISKEKEYYRRCKCFKACSYGEKNGNNKFRVICNKNRLASVQGLLSTVSALLPNMIEARQHGLIPVVDLCRNSRPQPMLQESELAKKENAWEYYFTQPNRDISLEEVRQSKYVEEQVKDCGFYAYYYMNDRYLKDAKQIRYLCKAVRQNIHLQEKIKQRVISEKRRLFPQADKIMGVGIRAGYRRGIISNLPLYNGHPIVGSCTECIKNIENRLAKWNYNYFFLAIDDRAYAEAIKKYFGGSCILLERPRIHFFQDALQDIIRAVGDGELMEFEGLSARNRNEDYLVELYLLSQCDALYASRGTGHNFAYLLNNGKYSRVEFDDLGEFRYAN